MNCEFNPPTVVLHRGKITEIEEEMWRWRNAGRLGTVAPVGGTVLLYACNDGLGLND